MPRVVEARSESGLLYVAKFALTLETVEYRKPQLIPVETAPSTRGSACPLLDLARRRFMFNRARRYLTAIGAALATAAATAVAADPALADVHITSAAPSALTTNIRTKAKSTTSLGSAVKVLRPKSQLICRDALLGAPSGAAIQRNQQSSANSSSTCSVPHPAKAGKGVPHVPHITDLHRHRPRRQPVHREVSGGAPLYIPQATTHPVPAREPKQRRARPELAGDRSLVRSVVSASEPAPATTSDAGAAIDPFTAAELEHFSSLVGNLDQPPRYLIPIYKAASRRYHVQWQILAAINAIETDYGGDLAVSPKGAIGWMQFMPATWVEFGVAADRRHRPNPYDPHDAIFSAARYLAANGAPRDIRRALFAYNHALWYVDAVLWRAQLISDKAVARGARSDGYALPLDAAYMRELGRTDDGVDIETAPDGAAVFSITPGIVTAVASDPGGFGPNYPVILATRGPLAGQFIYYGHVAASLVHDGQHVVAGEPIAVIGHTGDAASLGHGHIEIGFSDGSGNPLNHHGAIAWTPSGDAMRHVLIALSRVFRVR